MKYVAIRGINGSFHDQVSSKVFGESYQPFFCSNFSDVISKVEKGECDYGVLAIENSLAGSILENYHLLRNQYVEIIGEEYLEISHHLLALPGTGLQHIEKVISHEMALKQCGKFLDKTQIKDRQAFGDTATASQHISINQIKGTAAIGSDLAAKSYGLEVISSNIQDNSHNYTRFFIIQKPKNTGMRVHKNKATIIFSVEDGPGKLALVLNYLSAKGINLTKIESVPQFNNPGKFDMITDLELPKNEHFKDILPDLHRLVDEIKVLGIYDKVTEPQN
jgi:prephenate dehydratase